MRVLLIAVKRLIYRIGLESLDCVQKLLRSSNEQHQGAKVMRDLLTASMCLAFDAFPSYTAIWEVLYLHRTPISCM